MIKHLILHRALRPVLCTAIAIAALSTSVQAERSYPAWLKRFDPTSGVSQGGEAIAFDNRGNVAVTGFTFNQQGRKKYFTAKYAGNDGSLLWQVEFDAGLGDNIAHGVVCDSAGNVIVTGGAAIGSGTDLDLHTIKYAAADGAVIWQADFDANGGGDEGLYTTVDGADNVIVVGSSVGSSQQENVYLAKYSAAANGLTPGKPTVLWDTIFNLNNRKDVPRALSVDRFGNIAVSGITNDSAGSKYYTGRYNGTNGLPIWEKVFPVAGTDSDHEASGVAVDNDGNVFTTGRAKNGGDYDILTIKYSAANGSILWDEAHNSPGDNFVAPAGVVVDSLGNAIVAGTTVENSTFQPNRFYVAQYAGDDGTVLWQTRSSPPDDEDRPRRIAIDSADNVIVTGTSQQPNTNRETRTDDDYYTASYNGATGAVQWEQRFRGSRTGDADDIPLGVAVDALGNVAITGTAFRNHPNNATGLTEFVTIKYQRLALVTGDPAPGAGVQGSGVPKNAVFKTLSAATLSDSGALAAQVSVKAGTTVLNGILYSGPGGTFLPAVQKQAAPGITGAKYKSFLDPVIAPNGSLAFFAKLTGVPDAEAGAVVSNFNSEQLQTVVQLGKTVPIPGFDAGVLVKSVSTISVRNGFLIGLLKIKGTGVTDENNTLLMGARNAGNNQLLRTGQLLTAGDPETAITKISVLQPAAGSAGQGRWHGSSRVMARVTLKSGSQVVLYISSAGGITQLLKTGDNVNGIDQAKFASFGLPSVASNSLQFAVAGTFDPDLGGVTDGTDTGVFYSSTGATFSLVAREGGDAPDTGATAAKFAKFFDPASNNSADVAFLATLKGTGVKDSNKTGLWWGTGTTVDLVRRTGDKAPKPNGEAGSAKFTALSSFVLPNGPGSAPVFVGKIAGNGITSSNNAGVWAVGSDNVIRELLRTGDKFGKLKVKSFSIFGNGRGAFGVGRNYNSTGGVVALVTFTDGKKAIVPLSNP